MLRRTRETAPAGLVPLAWGFTIAAHLGLVADRPVLIAHLVMDVLLVAFVALSWSDMAAGVLRAWRLVILVGIPVTLAGTVGLLVAGDPASSPLVATSLVGWTLLPVPALWYTGRESRGVAQTVNYTAAGLAAAGALVHLGGLVAGAVPDSRIRIAGLALVGVGQTVGIVDAAVRY
ncbi:hypothetical protein [Halobaculum magnesiiphilum]|uniref:Uncharacterized protein n=1 Tax=Halobaculum magnesiiphilum TaxID=1017351 RepID=A0A8T8WF89_9EURY|nr:hypothetical protein [Halobaculum magnesiiphilum]QZP38500.1 hypothetical protein K6T50_04990 [Halobaculum magnesiiphilum]